MIDKSVWFYTLSTISQTCAAILALGGTFVIFKLDKVQTALNNYRGRVLKIVQAWRLGTKQPDKFYDETEKDVLSQYRTIVKDNKNSEDIFDKRQITRLICMFENTTIIIQEREGVDRLDNGVILDHLERKRWCNRMADLLEKNISIEKTIYRYLRTAFILLSISIIASIFLLNYLPDLKIDKYILFVTTGWSIISILFSGFAVWKIAKFRPIL